MKKFVFAFFTIGLFIISTNANAQQRLKFYFYPSANVYYDVTHKLYSYNFNGRWMTAAELPQSIILKPEPAMVVWHATPNVWINNKWHVEKYSGYSNPKRPDRLQNFKQTKLY